MTETYRSQEDVLAESIIERLPGTAEVEVHYNHYGDRGVVDVVIEDIESEGELGTLSVFELKSESAVREATGANEIIRQFKRQRKYFLTGSDYNPQDYFNITHHLTFYATADTVDHLRANEELYKTVVNKTSGRVSSVVGIRHPEVDRAGWPLITHKEGSEWVHKYAFESVIGSEYE